MCHTTITTHMLCMHTTNTFTRCSISYLTPSPSLLSFFSNSPPNRKCKPSTGETFLNDLCTTCLQFFSQMDIIEAEARHRAFEYRQRMNYHGKLMPFLGDEGEVRFSREDVVHPESEGEVKYRSQLNAWWGTDDSETLDGIQEPSRRSSTETVWPSARNLEEQDIGEQRLDGLFEIDEWGEEIEVLVRRSSMLASLDAVELVELERVVPGRVDGDRDERPRVMRPVGAIPNATPQRKASMREQVEKGAGDSRPSLGSESAER